MEYRIVAPAGRGKSQPISRKQARRVALMFFGILLQREPGDVVELSRAGVDLFSSEATEPLEAELFNGEAAHHRAMDHGPAQRPVINFPGGGKRAHEAA